MKIDMEWTRYCWQLDSLVDYAGRQGLRNNRPPLHRLSHRLRCAIAVLLGYADAVEWPGIQRRKVNDK